MCVCVCVCVCVHMYILYVYIYITSKRSTPTSPLILVLQPSAYLTGLEPILGSGPPTRSWHSGGLSTARQRRHRTR